MLARSRPAATAAGAALDCLVHVSAGSRSHMMRAGGGGSSGGWWTTTATSTWQWWARSVTRAMATTTTTLRSPSPSFARSPARTAPRFMSIWRRCVRSLPLACLSNAGHVPVCPSGMGLRVGPAVPLGCITTRHGKCTSIEQRDCLLASWI